MCLYRARLRHHLGSLKGMDREAVQARVRYYNKCSSYFSVAENSKTLAQLNSKQQSAYFYDLRAIQRYFPEKLRFLHEFGDVIKVPMQPCIVKSRPINADNRNAIILKLNRVRHYVFVNDKLAFEDKKDMAVWRGKAKPGHCRSQLVKDWHSHIRCNIGQTNKVPIGTNNYLRKDFLSIDEQLKYKFIVSVEGNDVATNLKWIMSSNSLCLMRKPRYETWFMEGLLKAGVHYVLLKDDFSDLEEKINFYSAHPELALAIIENANRWVDQFRDEKVERLIGLLVMQQYFEYSGQWVGWADSNMDEAQGIPQASTRTY